ADAIAVTREQAGEDRCEVDQEIAFATVDGAKIHGRRKVQQEVRVDLTVLEVLAHEGGVEARGDVPVDVPDVVAEGVFADVREVQPLALEDRAVVALEQTVQTADHGPVES